VGCCSNGARDEIIVKCKCISTHLTIIILPFDRLMLMFVVVVDVILTLLLYCCCVCTHTHTHTHTCIFPYLSYILLLIAILNFKFKLRVIKYKYNVGFPSFDNQDLLQYDFLAMGHRVNGTDDLSGYSEMSEEMEFEGKGTKIGNCVN
jgi:hypothetical protein